MSGLKLKYFVLKPAGDTLHAQACREAMRTYAYIMKDEIPELYHDLIEWADYEELARDDRMRKETQMK
jgi:hypothetical protein